VLEFKQFVLADFAKIHRERMCICCSLAHECNYPFVWLTEMVAAIC